MLPASLIARLAAARSLYLPDRSPRAASDAIQAIEEETPPGTSFLAIADAVHSLQPATTPRTLDNHHAFVLCVLLRCGKDFIRRTPAEPMGKAEMGELFDRFADDDGMRKFQESWKGRVASVSRHDATITITRDDGETRTFSVLDAEALGQIHLFLQP